MSLQMGEITSMTLHFTTNIIIKNTFIFRKKAYSLLQKFLSLTHMSSAESQKGAIADQRCSVENQKGAIDFVQQ